MKSHVVKKQHHCLGWIPHTDTYVLIQNSTCPPEAAILQHVSWEPESKLSNLPLSVFNLIHFADKIGATDDVLLQMITCYLRKNRPTILDSLDQRKNSLHAVIESLAFQCTTDAERSTVLIKFCFCWYLYHDTGRCIYFDQNGKSRPASRNRVD